MPPKLRPAEFVVVDCGPGCTLNPRKSPIADALHEAYCAGMNDMEISALSDKLGNHVSAGAVGRHRAAHLTRRDQAGVVMMGAAVDGAVDHVKVLELMIARGARVAHTWRLGPGDTLKAIEMHYRLTEGKSDNALIDALAAASAGAVEVDDPESSETEVVVGLMRELDE